jgi:hypothetical protein
MITSLDIVQQRIKLFLDLKNTEIDDICAPCRRKFDIKIERLASLYSTFFDLNVKMSRGLFKYEISSTQHEIRSKKHSSRPAVWLP